MVTKYTDDLKIKVNAVPKPVPFRWELREEPNALIFIIYEDDIVLYNTKNREYIMEYLKEIMRIVKNHGVNVKLTGVRSTTKRLV